MRQWLRFSLRSVFVLITALCVFLGYEFEWIRRRRRLLDERFLPILQFERNDWVASAKGQIQYLDMSEQLLRKKAPPFLWLFGEVGYGEISVLITYGPDVKDTLPYPITTAAHPVISRAQSLFPEAEIKAHTWTTSGSYVSLCPVIIKEHEP